MEKELRELYESKLILTTEKAGLPKYAIGKLAYGFAEGDKKNLNFRTYPEALLQREIEKKNKEIEKGGILGQLDHPLDGNTKLSLASHVLSNLSYEKTSKIALAESLILDTTAGRDFLVVLQTKPKIGASMRGWGNTSPKGIVQDDWQLSSIDFVLNPSFGDISAIDATNLIESFNPEESELGEFHRKLAMAEEEKVKKTKIKIDEKNILLALKIQHDAAIQEYGDTRTFEEFKKENIMLMTAEWLLQNYEKEFKNIREALDYLGSGDLLEKYYEANEEIRTEPYTQEEVSHEAYEAGVNPKEFADKLNENLKVSLTLKAAGITDKERQLMDEMQEAGVLGTPQELLEKARKMEQAQEIFKPELSEEQKKIEDVKKLREQKKARRERIIYEINRDISAGGGAEPGGAKKMVREALKAEGLELDE